MNIDETISQVEKLFEKATGKQINASDMKYTINPNIDPISLLEARVNQLAQVLNDPAVIQKLQPWNPAASVWENDDKIIVRLDVPAVSKEDVDIALRANMLTISGVRKNLPQDAGFIPRMIEVSYGHFLRSIVLPVEILTSDISSSLRDGVLEVTLLKQGTAKSKKPTSNKTPQ